MEIKDETYRLRIYISSTDKIGHELLNEFLVREAHKQGLAGATVLRGILGYGASSVIHSYKFWEISEKVPLVLEIVDSNEKLCDFFADIQPKLESLRYGCLVTIEKVEVLLYKTGDKRVIN